MWSIEKGKSGDWYIGFNGDWYDGVVYHSAEDALEALSKHSPSAAMNLAFSIPRTRTVSI